MTDHVAAAEMRLARILETYGPLAIAVSGGVDSMTLAFVAHAHGADVRMVHALSPAVPQQATDRVRHYAEHFGWSLETTSAAEFDDPDYLKNPVNRCFFCKTNLYSRISALTPRQIASGANLDDLSDYRPGLMAAADHNVVHPLIEAGIDKAMVRLLAAQHGLDDLAELPAQPCLSSRVETGIAINAIDLAFVNDVETAMRERLPTKGDVRCRITSQGVVLEIDPFDAPGAKDAINAAQKMIARSGRNYVTARPYLRGSAFLGKPEADGTKVSQTGLPAAVIER